MSLEVTFTKIQKVCLQIYILLFGMNMLQMRQKRASSSKKSSRRRQELMQAKEFEMKQHVQQEKVRISKTVASIVAVIFGTQR